MADVPEVSTTEPSELLATGRRHLAVRDYSAAVGALAHACELLAAKHGDSADQCAEAYLWYGKALLGLAHEESGVLGDGIAQGTTEDGDAGDSDEQDDGSEDKQGNDADTTGAEKSETSPAEVGSSVASTSEVEHMEQPEEAPSSSAETDNEKPGPSNEEMNGDAKPDDSVAELGDEDDVENLQLAWEMLELSRGILAKRVENGGGDAARALLADVHLTLGEVALESETYDKAVIDMQSCLDIQKDLYRNDDRRIAETHYQIGLANSLSSNFEDAITHFKNAANILESRIKTLENPSAATDDATVKKYSANDPFYSVAGEIKELKELLPEIQEKIQDMMDYKAETIKRVRETLCPSNGASSSGAGPSNGSSSIGLSSSSASSSTAPKQASDISHLIKRKRKSSTTEEGGTPAKKSSS